MHAITFDMSISALKEHYNEKYHSAYTEIKKSLKENGFYWIQGSTYASNGDLKNLFEAIESLKKIDWFCKSVRDIRAFKIEDYSDFTDSFKKARN